jgi:hypothetical protein
VSELRAPDPTLTAFAGDVVWLDGSCRPPVAHTFACLDEDDRVPMWRSLDSTSARWFAVPCRKCFPDAPPPGCVCSRDEQGRVLVSVPEPGLAWQVAR